MESALFYQVDNYSFTDAEYNAAKARKGWANRVITMKDGSKLDRDVRNEGARYDHKNGMSITDAERKWLDKYGVFSTYTKAEYDAAKARKGWATRVIKMGDRSNLDYQVREEGAKFDFQSGMSLADANTKWDVVYDPNKKSLGSILAKGAIGGILGGPVGVIIGAGGAALIENKRKNELIKEQWKASEQIGKETQAVKEIEAEIKKLQSASPNTDEKPGLLASFGGTNTYLVLVAVIILTGLYFFSKK